jgi:riboflavin kinase / FMN adenylyltransferase
MSGAVVTVGTFDGLHRGHQRVLAEVVARARDRGLTSVLVLCDPHPLEVVNPAAAPKLLTLPDEKRELLAGAGLDRVVVLPFTREVAQQSPEEFIRGLRVEQALQLLVIGYDHAFGRGRSGDEALVRRLGAAAGFDVAVVDAVREDGQPISSTLIRAAVAHGDLAGAARWLGRPYGVLGRVVPGAGRGRTIGVPTLNLAPPDARKLLPPDGVYGVWVWWRGTRYGGMMNQGPRPTFAEQGRTLEVHVFDFAADLYGETVRVEWVQRLRDVQAFPSREALVAQLERDRQAARASLNR